MEKTWPYLGPRLFPTMLFMKDGITADVRHEGEATISNQAIPCAPAVGASFQHAAPHHFAHATPVEAPIFNLPVPVSVERSLLLNLPFSYAAGVSLAYAVTTPDAVGDCCCLRVIVLQNHEYL